MNDHNDEIQRLETFLSIAKKLTSELNLDLLLDTIMAEVTLVMGAERSSLYLIDEERNEIWTKIMQGLDEIIRIPIGKGISGMVAATGKTLRIDDAWEYPGFDRSWDIHNNFRTKSVLCTPIKNKEGKMIGVIQVINKLNGSFSQSDEDMLSGLTSLIAISIENAMLHKEALERQRIEAELELAAKIQRQLLPKSPPQIDGYEIACISVPARQVGGDYYDFIEEEDGNWAIVVGDISGKGIPAAILMATAMSALHAIVTPSLTERLSRLNDLIHDSTDSWQYSTLFYASLDPKKRTITTVNAGHNAMMLLRTNGEIELLDVGGIAIGMFDSEISQYVSEQHSLSPGDFLVLFTDGIPDATNDRDENFGELRLMNLLRSNTDKSAQEMVNIIYEEVTRFAGDTPQFDDLTIVVLKAL